MQRFLKSIYYLSKKKKIIISELILCIPRVEGRMFIMELKYIKRIIKIKVIKIV